MSLSPDASSDHPQTVGLRLLGMKPSPGQEHLIVIVPYPSSSDHLINTYQLSEDLVATKEEIANLGWGHIAKDYTWTLRITHTESIQAVKSDQVLYPERPSKKCRSGFPPKMSLPKKDATSYTCVVSGNLSFSWLFLPKLIFNNHFRFCDALHGTISPTTTWDVKKPCK